MIGQLVQVIGFEVNLLRVFGRTWIGVQRRETSEQMNGNFIELVCHTSTVREFGTSNGGAKVR